MSEVIKGKEAKKKRKKKHEKTNAVPFKQNLQTVSKIESPVSPEEAETKRVKGTKKQRLLAFLGQFHAAFVTGRFTGLNSRERLHHFAT